MFSYKRVRNEIKHNNLIINNSLRNEIAKVTQNNLTKNQPSVNTEMRHENRP